MSGRVNIDEQLESSEGRAYIARRLLEACEDAGEIKDHFTTIDAETADTVIRVVKSREFKRGYIKFKEKL